MDADNEFPYRDRPQAGEHILTLLTEAGFSAGGEIIVLAIPRGGALVGLPVARGLGAPLGLIHLRKLPLPRDPEMGFGVVTQEGQVLLNQEVLDNIPITNQEREETITRVKEEVRRRWEVYKEASPVSEGSSYLGKRLILVDDGLATGYTMLGALESLRRKKPDEIIVAVPTAHGSAYELVRSRCERLICPHISHAKRFAVAEAYLDFHDPSDGEVLSCLKKCSIP